MRKEKVNGQQIARTGWTTTARCCPVHGSALELVFDETDRSSWSSSFPKVDSKDDENRVRWRCEACVGSYTENYFIRAPDFRPPSPHRLLLRCPSCGSRRVSHDCVPECCEQHGCPDCSTGFVARVELVERGSRKSGSDEDSDSQVVPRRDLRMTTGGPPAHRSGFTRDFRRCPKPAHREPLELVFLPWGDSSLSSAPLLLGWYCAACDGSWTESCFHHHERGFISDASPGVSCAQCASTQVESEGDDGVSARCTTCGARLRVHLER
jgi:hypothetical protein